MDTTTKIFIGLFLTIIVINILVALILPCEMLGGLPITAIPARCLR